MRNLVLLLCLYFTSLGAIPHDFHVSRLVINHNTKTGTLELTLDTFIDDVELQLGALAAVDANTDLTAANCNFGEANAHPLADSLYGHYLTQVLELATAATTLPLDYLGTETAGDPYGMYAYLSHQLDSDSPGELKLTLKSRYFTNLYDDQQNIIVWKRDGKDVGYNLLTRSDITASRTL